MTESLNTISSYDSNSTNNSLIKVGVHFDIQQIGMDSETPLLSDTNESNTNSDFNTVNITLDINDDIPIFIQSSYNENNNIVTDGINDMKDCLKSTMNKLYEMIDFLKQELEEKNLLIRTLTLREANDGNFVNEYSNETANDTKEVVINDIVSDLFTTDNTENIYISEDVSEYYTDFDIWVNNSASENLNSTVLVEEMNETKIRETRYYESVEYQLKNYRAAQGVKYTNVTATEKQDILGNDGLYENISSALLFDETNRYENISSALLVDETNKTYLPESRYFNIRHDEGNITNSQRIPMNVRTLNMLKDHTDIEEVHKWPKNTILIVGDSIINGIEESRITKKFPVKVRSYQGAKISDMYDYLTPLLKKEPTYIFLHVGSNNSPNEDSTAILDKLLLLKMHIKLILPNVKIYLSCPVLRIDDAKANLTLRNFTNKLKSLNIDVIINDNVDVTCLGKAGLHLNPKGSGRLAMNFLSLMRRL